MKRTLKGISFQRTTHRIKGRRTLHSSIAGSVPVEIEGQPSRLCLKNLGPYLSLSYGHWGFYEDPTKKWRVPAVKAGTSQLLHEAAAMSALAEAFGRESSERRPLAATNFEPEDFLSGLGFRGLGVRV